MDHHSERLTLHPFSAEEAARVADGAPAEGDRWAPDYPVADEVPLLRALARRLGTGTDPHPFTLHVVVERSTGTAIGGLGFFGPPGPDGAVEIGYGLVPSARGRGYATEAVRLAVEIALAGGAVRVEAGTDPANLASQRVLRKAGFTEVGRRGDELRFALQLAPQWYAVRCLFAVGWPPEAAGGTYEERITLWRASSAAEAIARAEAEALDYAAAIDESPSTYLGLAQSYHLDDEPGHGAEVFSLMRTSELDPETYLDTFFDTGFERQSELGEPADD